MKTYKYTFVCLNCGVCERTIQMDGPNTVYVRHICSDDSGPLLTIMSVPFEELEEIQPFPLPKEFIHKLYYKKTNSLH